MNITLNITSGANITNFTLSKDIIDKIEYFKFIDELKYTENTVHIELDYTTYLATITDIIELLNIKSNNYLSIIREPSYYLEKRNMEQIDFYLRTKQINLEMLISNMNDPYYFLKIKHIPTLICIYILHITTSYNGCVNTKYLLSKSNDYIAEIHDTEVIDIRCKKTLDLLYSINLERNPKLHARVLGLDNNNILMIDYDYNTYYLLLTNNSYKILDYVGMNEHNYCVKSRYYFSYDDTNACVYDFVTDTSYYIRYIDLIIENRDLIYHIETKLG